MKLIREKTGEGDKHLHCSRKASPITLSTLPAIGPQCVAPSAGTRKHHVQELVAPWVGHQTASGVAAASSAGRSQGSHVVRSHKHAVDPTALSALCESGLQSLYTIMAELKLKAK